MTWEWKIKPPARKGTWRDTGWHTLAGEMRPGTIGGELLELEQQQENGVEVVA
ncbi:MAG: hypothetical protein WC029_00275 [Sulfuricella sp.]